MSDRRITFEHDGHRFEAVERVTDPRAGSRGSPAGGAGEARVAWVVSMDGREVLDFHGQYPYRDADVRKRVLEWYGIQKR
jgi:hypothetical protein